MRFIMWKKIVESEELVIYEKKYRNFDVKIEARQISDDEWEVFKKYTGNEDLSYVEQFVVSTKDELNFLIKRLMKKSFSAKQIEQIKIRSSKLPRLHLKRDFKEYCMEKWVFTVDSDKSVNMVFIKFDETTGLDIIMHEKYRDIKEKILAEINRTFNLENTNDDIETNIFFYSQHVSLTESRAENDLVSRFEIGFEPQEE